MPITLEKVEIKSFDRPDEVRTFEKGRLELVKACGKTIGRATFQPGWKWSEHLKKTAGTESCQGSHLGYQVSGTMAIRMDDGSERVCRAGNVMCLPPGHDAWVVGSEPVVFVDFQGMEDYAKKP